MWLLQVSVSCKDGEHTCAGDSFVQDIIPLLWRCPSVAAVGVNCTAPAHVAALMAAGHKAISELAAQGGREQPLLLLCYPNR